MKDLRRPLFRVVGFAYDCLINSSIKTYRKVKFMKIFIRRALKLRSTYGNGAGKKLTLTQAIDYGVDLERLHLECGKIGFYRA